MKKRYLTVVLLTVLFSVLLAGCSRQPQTEEGHLKIVCTIFPQYDWTRQVLGELEDETEVTLLMKNGSDLHSYQPTVWDMVAISEADLFFYIGGTSDFWVQDALENVKNPDQIALDLMEVLETSLKEEEHDHGHEHEEAHDHEEHEMEGVEYDEHIWLSLRNAQISCNAIAKTLAELDSAHADVYERNAEDYNRRLAKLDEEYIRVTSEAEKQVLLFGDRFPFRYLADDYGLTCYAAFSGCSAETEASFETITSLAERVDELGLPAVLAIDGSDQKIARTIADNTRTRDQKVLMLDSMQSVSEDEIEKGESYLAIMNRNLDVLSEALNVTRR